MIKILTIIGARPQIIKAAALSRAIKKNFSDKIEEKILHTGQHYDTNMSEVFFQELEIPQPHFNLNIGSGYHGEQTARMITGIEQVLFNEKFDAVVVFGDTNSTLAGALAASKIHIPVIHIEAGLRSFNMAMPEEINRIVCDQLSSLLFAPTQTAMDNLKQEGFMSSKTFFSNGMKRIVINSGDIMYDNSLYYSTIADFKTDISERLKLKEQEYLLATIHRDSNTDDPVRLSAIFEAFLEIVEKYCIRIILPIHPRTQKSLSQNLSVELYNQIKNNNYISLIPPASFFEIIVLEKNAKLIITDSGGLQKEAYFFGKPCIILRTETEWVEIIEQKAGIIADANKNRIFAAFEQLKNSDIQFSPIFGNGHAAEFILEKIIETINHKNTTSCHP